MQYLLFQVVDQNPNGIMLLCLCLFFATINALAGALTILSTSLLFLNKTFPIVTLDCFDYQLSFQKFQVTLWSILLFILYRWEIFSIASLVIVELLSRRNF